MSIRTVVEFEDIMQVSIVSILEWQTTPNNVRIGWQTDGAPAFKITDNMIFLTASPVDNQINRQHNIQLEESSPDLLMAKGYTRIMELSVVAYGSNALLNLDKIIFGMFSDSVRASLKAYDIYLVPDVVAPRRMPELFQAQWWERADMKLQFSELLTDETNINVVRSVDVEIQNKDGLLDEFTVENL